MNTTKTISVLILTAASAWGQAAATKATATAPASKTTTTKPASQMAPATAAKTTASKTAATTTSTAKTSTAKTDTAKATTAPMKAAAKPATTAAAAKKPVAKISAKTVAAKTAPGKTAAKSIAPEKPIGKRDPFVSVIVARSDVSAACTGGKRCLMVDQLALRGIVRTPTKWIALVENPARKTYYLYENDPIFNAVVVRITGDSVIFRENVMDALGHSTEREVVKRVNAPAI
jgi:hypothetical protein